MSAKAIVSFHAFTEPGFYIQLNHQHPGETRISPYLQYQPSTRASAAQGYVYHDLEVTKQHSGWVVLKLSFEVFMANQSLYERSIRITNKVDVNIEDVQNMALAPIITPDYCISMGMYVPNPLFDSDLPSNIQIYVTVTRNYENWMGQLFKRIGTTKSLLKNLILPGSHDSGMYVNRMPIAINNVANTQKDDVATQLKLGARFFDFRPGRFSPEFVALLRQLKDSTTIGAYLEGYSNTDVGTWLSLALKVGKKPLELAVESAIKVLLPVLESLAGMQHHIHAVLPGESMTTFVQSIGSFLEAHPQEIVVLKISDAGIVRNIRLPELNMHPVYLDGKRLDGQEIPLIELSSSAEIMAEIRQLLQHSPVQIGDKSCLQRPIDQLLAANQRLIIVFQDGLDVLSSYSDDYLSCDGERIYQALTRSLEEIAKPEHRNKELIDLQLQLTASGDAKALQAGLAVYTNVNATTSPLMGTKARTDSRTYGFIHEYVSQFANQNGLTTFINDYYDNGLSSQVYHANLLAAAQRGIHVAAE